MRYSWNISLPFCAKQQREVTKFNVWCRTQTHGDGEFSLFYNNSNNNNNNNSNNNNNIVTTLLSGLDLHQVALYWRAKRAKRREASQASRSDAQGVAKRGDLSRLQEFDSNFPPKPRSINYQGVVLLQARDFLSRSQVSRILVCDGGK